MRLFEQDASRTALRRAPEPGRTTSEGAGLLYREDRQVDGEPGKDLVWSRQ